MLSLINRLLGVIGLRLNRVQGKSYFQGIEGFISIGQNVKLQAFNIDVRNKSLSETILKIGDDAIVSGNFVFETNTGTIDIGKRSFIGGGTFICIEKILIGNDVMISWGCTLIDNNAHSLISTDRKNDVIDWKRGLEEGVVGKYKDWSRVRKAGIVIKDKAWIGFNSIILKGVTIGEGAVVGAGSVVSKDVPDYGVVAGNPATLIKFTK